MQWATTCAVEFSLAQLLQVMILLATGGANGGGYLASKYVLIAMHGGILFLHALINSLNITWLSYVTIIAAAWNVVGECSSSITRIHPTPQPARGRSESNAHIRGIFSTFGDYYWNIPNVYSRQSFQDPMFM